MKIAWICAQNEEAAQTRIRVLNISRSLEHKMWNTEVIQDYKDVLRRDFDVAIVGKSFSKEDYEAILMLRHSGKTIICDLCESIFEFPFVIEIIEICNLVVCCSTELEKQVKQFNKRTLVIEDAIEV